MKGLEQELVLLNEDEDFLSWRLAPYIFKRTNGIRRHVIDLLRRGADNAIRSGAERLDKPLLDQIKLPPPRPTGRR